MHRRLFVLGFAGIGLTAACGRLPATPAAATAR